MDKFYTEIRQKLESEISELENETDYPIEQIELVIHVILSYLSRIKLDEKMFIRGNHDIKLWLDTYYFQSDHTFSTSHDYKVAKIMANDLIQVYIEDKLYRGDELSSISADPKSPNWTGSKAALIELIYALQTHGDFNNGKTDIRVIARYFENVFDIDLGDFYHTYLEIKNRKINRTKFLDALREALIKKMDDQDE